MWRLPPILLTLACMVSPSAHAQYLRSGYLGVTYDDITVYASDGPQRTTDLSKSYGYSLSGPLGHPLLGTGQASLNYSQGVNIAQAVNTSDSGRELFEYSFSANLLPPHLKRFITLAPSFSRTKTTQSWGSPQYQRALVDSSNGLSMGLTLPNLPSIMINRSWVNRQDHSAQPSIDQKNTRQNERLAYVQGPLKIDYNHDLQITDDYLSSLSSNRSNQKTLNLEVSPLALPKLIQTSLARFSYQDLLSQSGQLETRFRSMTASAFASSQKWKSGSWDSYSTMGLDLSGDIQQHTENATTNLSLVSTKKIQRGRLDHFARYRRGIGSINMESIEDSLIADWGSSMIALNHQVQGTGGWSWSEESGTSFSSSAKYRAGYTPRLKWDYYADVTASATEAMNDHQGDSASTGWGSGFNWRPWSAADGSLNYVQTKTWDKDNDISSFNQSLSSVVKIVPWIGFNTSLKHTLQWNRKTNEENTQNSSTELNIELRSPVGFTLSTNLTYQSGVFNAVASGGYSLGQTQLQLRYDRQELYSASSYSYTSLSLTRSFH